ncbi:EF-hand domain-containing protein [Streptomyces sp. NPDC054932]
MATDLLTRKINRHFDLIDTDGNGRITKEDFDLIVTRMADQFGHAPGSPKFVELAEVYGSLWNGLRENLDTDGDGAVSREEYAHGLTSGVLTGEGYEQLMQPVAKVIFGLCDTNGDGRLDREEIAKAHLALGVQGEDHEAAMARLDRNGDGFVDEKELAQALQDFFLSKDDNAPGNLLFGRI